MEMLRHRREALKDIVKSPAFAWTVVATGFILMSAVWAAVPQQSIKVGLSFFGVAVFGLVLLRQAGYQSAAECASTQMALVTGVAAAILLLVVGTVYGLTYNTPLWGKEYQHPLATLSHAQTVIGILFTPAVALLWERGGKYLIVAFILMAIFAVTFFHLEHSASNLAIAAAFVAYLIIKLTGKFAFVGLCLLASASIFLMPFVLGIAMPDQDALNAMTTDAGPWPSEIHRLHMWRFATDAIANGNVLIGYGADASRGFPGATQKIMWGIELMPLHPHNGALQVWLELGLIGVLLSALVPLLMIKAMSKSEPGELALSGALLAAYLAPWMLSYGIWQSWWMAMAWLIICIGRGIVSPEAHGRA